MPVAKTGDSSKREYYAGRMRKKFSEWVDIGPIPKVVDPERKESCRNNFRLFCETYRGHDIFYYEWSEDHLRVLEIMENVVRDGGLFALAMPRGSGKTTLAITAAIWAVLYGHRKFICLVGATAGKAEELLKSIKTELRFNPLLQEDFPETCFPVLKLEGKSMRAAGQTTEGVPTNMQWVSNRIMLADVEGSDASSSVISVAGITGDIRGQQVTTPNGRVIRPDLVIPDDPQTRESANSETQTDQRLRTIQGDILGLAGPGIDIACVMPGTVIKRYDLMDRILRKEDYLDWHTVKSQMLYGKPENPEMWERYREIRDNCLKNDLPLDDATDYYTENQENMDLGLRSGWESRIPKGSVSAIQASMDLMFRDYEAFMAEYQNEPEEEADSEALQEQDIWTSVGHLGYEQVSLESNKLVAFVDIQKEALYWVVCCLGQGFTGAVVDYGQWPKQRDKNVSLRNLRSPLSKIYKGLTFEERLRRALTDCTDYLLNKVWLREDEVEFKISRLLVDANWGQTRDIVYNWVRTSGKHDVIIPSHGKFVGASSQPLNHSVTKSTAMMIGTHWRVSKSKEMPIRYVLYDTNYWKSFTADRFKLDAGVFGAISLPNDEKRNHKELMFNLTSEYPVKVEGRGRIVDEWKLKPGRDNHFWDCIVGCCVAGSIEGVSLEKSVVEPVQRKPKRKKVYRID